MTLEDFKEVFYWIEYEQVATNLTDEELETEYEYFKNRSRKKHNS